MAGDDRPDTTDVGHGRSRGRDGGGDAGLEAFELAVDAVKLGEKFPGDTAAFAADGVDRLEAVHPLGMWGKERIKRIGAETVTH